MKDTVMVLQRIQQIVNACHIDNHTYRSDEHEEEIQALTKAMQTMANDDWKPVTEDLPEPWVNVMVTYITPVTSFITPVTLGMTPRTGMAYVDENNFWHINKRDAVVTAWMPLPEPYKEEV